MNKDQGLPRLIDVANKKRDAQDHRIKTLEKETPEEILEDIWYHYQSPITPDPNERIAKVLPRFSSLLVLLSRQAEKQTKKIINLTWAIIVFTVVLCFFTAILVCIELKKDGSAYKNNDNLTYESIKKTSKDNDVTPKGATIKKETYPKDNINKHEN
jgi:hypothetical protein